MQQDTQARSPWSRRTKVLAALLGALLTGTATFAVSNWIVGLNANSKGQAKGSTITNLTITASATPAINTALYPGGNGDVVISISNPNDFPVTITAVNLPTNTTYAAGYTNSDLSTGAVGGCDGSSSLVSWRYASGVSGTSHTLTSAVTVGASGASNNPLIVTLTGVASMGMNSPLACAGLHFSMPSFTAITATGGDAVVTTSPATSSWTS
jgi:hypothetical protein